MGIGVSRRGLWSGLRGDRGDASGAGAGRRADAVAQIVGSCVEATGVACRRCREECAADAISYRLAKGGRALTRIDVERCEGCGACVTVCPTQALALVPRERAALALALADYARPDAQGGAS